MERALAYGRVSAEDAAIYCAMAEDKIQDLLPIEDYITKPNSLPEGSAAIWFVLCRIKTALNHGVLEKFSTEELNQFLLNLPKEQRFALLVGNVKKWGDLGVDKALFISLQEVTGLPD